MSKKLFFGMTSFIAALLIALARVCPLRRMGAAVEVEVMEEAEAEVMEGAEAVITAPEGMLAEVNPLTAAAARPIPPIMVLLPGTTGTVREAIGAAREAIGETTSDMADTVGTVAGVADGGWAWDWISVGYTRMVMATPTRRITIIRTPRPAYDGSSAATAPVVAGPPQLRPQRQSRRQLPKTSSKRPPKHFSITPSAGRCFLQGDYRNALRLAGHAGVEIAPNPRSTN